MSRQNKPTAPKRPTKTAASPLQMAQQTGQLGAQNPLQAPPTLPLTWGDEAAHDIKDCLGQFAPEQAALLPLLHAVQEKLGFIPSATVPSIAHRLNISVAQVHAVLQFYTYFKTQPPADLHIEICQAEACLAQQAQALAHYIADYLDCPLGSQRADNRVALHKVYCLGLCSHGPVAQINETPYLRLNPERLAALIDELCHD